MDGCTVCPSVSLMMQQNNKQQYMFFSLSHVMNELEIFNFIFLIHSCVSFSLRVVNKFDGLGPALPGTERW